MVIPDYKYAENIRYRTSEREELKHKEMEIKKKFLFPRHYFAPE